RSGSTCFFFNGAATTEIYTLSLHDALPISRERGFGAENYKDTCMRRRIAVDRKSTRLNSSHGSISYAVFCLKKKKQTTPTLTSKTKKKQHNTQPTHLAH